MKDQSCVPCAPSSTVDRSTGEDNLNKILCMLTVTAISVLLSSSATSRTRYI